MASSSRAVQAPTVTPMATVSLGGGCYSSDSSDSSDSSGSSDSSDNSDNSDSSDSSESSDNSDMAWVARFRLSTAWLAVTVTISSSGSFN